METQAIDRFLGGIVLRSRTSSEVELMETQLAQTTPFFAVAQSRTSSEVELMETNFIVPGNNYI